MTKRFLSALVLSGALLAPTVILADDDAHVSNRRYYDKEHKDYHQWNRDEDQTYRQYLQENHRPYRDFNRLKRNDQDRYWTWRHDHGDQHNADRHDDSQHDRR
jgi:hypothetical protein